MKKSLLAAGVLASSLLLSPLSLVAHAADYKVDVEGAHAFIQFKIKHLGYSWLLGRFNHFDGNFSYDEASPNKSNINIAIDVKSIDSNHAERDKHLRGKDFLDVNKFPKASFVSNNFAFSDENNAIVTGDFTLKGVTKSISFPVTKIGGGKDPWGGERVGFEGKTTLKLTDYNITYNLGPASTHAEISLFIEGIKQ